MTELDAHTLVRLGLIAFILAGALFVTMVPSFLLAALTVPGSVSLLLLLWIFIWIATILSLAVSRANRGKQISLTGPVVVQDAPARRSRPRARAAPARKARRKAR